MTQSTFENLNLDKVGINSWSEIIHNPSYDELFDKETSPANQGFEKGTVTKFGAVAVDTGRFTGRSPKDKYIVKEPENEDKVWWADDKGASSSDNKPLSPQAWEYLKSISLDHLNGQRLFVMDGFCGANPATRLKVRLVTDVAWMAHFFKNMFIRPSSEELEGFTPDWTILNACKITCPAEKVKEFGMRSEVFAAFNIAQKMTVIGGTWYGGEIKKGIFSIMNFMLPQQKIGSFHCSANMGEDGDTALFFGLSGTGKTTLSTDPKRELIGDDEHGWDQDGIFNLEGGCYAKVINLSKENEPDIYHAIKKDALLENVVVDQDGEVDFSSTQKTQNTRVSYPIYHIENIVKPVSKGTHPSKIIFLTCDAYGVLPPVSKLTNTQAMYHYLSGYTAKVAGTELGITEPQATFSACFGQAFLLLHPTDYADILGQKMEEHNSKAYLVNTGWIGGKYGVGNRISIKQTRAIIDAILDGSIEHSETESMPVFNLAIPKSIPGVDTSILNPRNAWEDKQAYDSTLANLASSFVEHFSQFTDTAKGKYIEKAGPALDK